jgi:hypothetical protein
MVYATKGALHFFDHQARNLVQPHQSLFFFPFYSTLMAGRQAGRRTGRAGIVHYFAISLLSRPDFSSFFFTILSQFYIRPDIEIKRTSSRGGPLFSLASSLFCTYLCLVNRIDLHREKMGMGLMKVVCGLDSEHAC